MGLPRVLRSAEATCGPLGIKALLRERRRASTAQSAHGPIFGLLKADEARN